MHAVETDSEEDEDEFQDFMIDMLYVTETDELHDDKLYDLNVTYDNVDSHDTCIMLADDELLELDTEFMINTLFTDDNFNDHEAHVSSYVCQSVRNVHIT